MSATLYLMRHSFAVPMNLQTTDEARWLSARGRECAREAGEALASHLRTSGQSIDGIVCSPLVRAVQTAELVAACLGDRCLPSEKHQSASEGSVRSNLEIVAVQALRSEAASQGAVDSLRRLSGRCLLAVSHEPLVSTMSAIIAGGGSAGGMSAGFLPSSIRGFESNQVIWQYEP